MTAFDRAIGVALDYQRSHPDTLVVVTADHGHTSQIVSEDATGTVVPVWGNGPGALAVLGTNDHTDPFHTLGGLPRPAYQEGPVIRLDDRAFPVNYKLCRGSQPFSFNAYS